MAPNRMTAYQNARAAAKPQKGLTYSELLMDNIIGLDNDYLSAGERLGQAFNADEIGFLKNAGISAYEGAKEVIADPIGAGEELLFGLYDSVSNLATEDLDARLKRMYGVGYDEASEDQVTSARESVFGDALTASQLIPGAALAKTGLDVAVVDPLQKLQADRFLRENYTPTFNPDAAVNSRYFYPSREEAVRGSTPRPGSRQAPEFGRYTDKAQEAEKLLREGVSPETVLNTTGIMPVPLRSTTGLDAGYRLVLPTDDQGITALRPSGKYRIRTLDNPNLPAGVLGQFGPSRFSGAGSLDYQIELDPNLGPEMRTSVYDHERGHADLMEGEVGWNELGMSVPGAFRLQQDSLATLDDLISTTTDVTEKAEYGRLRDELAKMTSQELYNRNPGEMLARLAQGDATMVKRLSALEVLNPYLRPGSPTSRIKDSLRTALMSETRPVVRERMASNPESEYLSGVDFYSLLPMDMDKALINDPGFSVENPSFVVNPNSPAGDVPRTGTASRPAEASAAVSSVSSQAPLKLLGPDPDKDQLPNTRGRGVRFHGATSPITELVSDYVSPSDQNIYGQGLYTSDAVAITEGYSRARGAKDGAVYRIEEVAPVNAFDMEQPVPQFLIDSIQGDLGFTTEDLLQEALSEEPKNVREFFDNVRELSPYYDLPRYEVQEIFDGLHGVFRENGFDALDHTGGLRTKRTPHNVRIYLNPSAQVKLVKADPNNPIPEALEGDVKKFNRGGIVTGSYLDNDPLDPALY